MGDREREKTLRRLAFQMMPELPEDRADALRVIDYLHQLLEWQHGPTKADIVPLPDKS